MKRKRPGDQENEATSLSRVYQNEPDNNENNNNRNLMSEYNSTFVLALKLVSYHGKLAPHHRWICQFVGKTFRDIFWNEESRVQVENLEPFYQIYHLPRSPLIHHIFGDREARKLQGEEIHSDLCVWLLELTNYRFTVRDVLCAVRAGNLALVNYILPICDVSFLCLDNLLQLALMQSGDAEFVARFLRTVGQTPPITISIPRSVDIGRYQDRLPWFYTDEKNLQNIVNRPKNFLDLDDLWSGLGLPRPVGSPLDHLNEQEVDCIEHFDWSSFPNFELSFDPILLTTLYWIHRKRWDRVKLREGGHAKLVFGYLCFTKSQNTLPDLWNAFLDQFRVTNQNDDPSEKPVSARCSIPVDHSGLTPFLSDLYSVLRLYFADTNDVSLLARVYERITDAIPMAFVAVLLKCYRDTHSMMERGEPVEHFPYPCSLSSIELEAVVKSIDDSVNRAHASPMLLPRIGIKPEVNAAMYRNVIPCKRPRFGGKFETNVILRADTITTPRGRELKPSMYDRTRCLLKLLEGNIKEYTRIAILNECTKPNNFTSATLNLATLLGQGDIVSGIHWKHFCRDASKSNHLSHVFHKIPIPVVSTKTFFDCILFYAIRSGRRSMVDLARSILNEHHSDVISEKRFPYDVTFQQIHLYSPRTNTTLTKLHEICEKVRGAVES
jgi:hypothetical protein